MAENIGKDKPPRVAKERRKSARDETNARQFFRKNRDVVPDVPFEMPANPLAALAKQTETGKSESSSPRSEIPKAKKGGQGQGADKEC